ncbi:MAG: hypothetical protein FWG11_09255 [Promicromonosporaceae bacterium]|nr:hypothetical protein [Promicromonosporaceae bacterium]
MPAPSGFVFSQRADDTVVISHHGRVVTKLRGQRAAQSLEEVDADPQLVMARWTGNYKHGNEHLARSHPRNRGR